MKGYIITRKKEYDYRKQHSSLHRTNYCFKKMDEEETCNVILSYGNIKNAEPCTIIDADLMGGIETNSDIVMSILNKQINMNCKRNDKKGPMITCCIIYE